MADRRISIDDPEHASNMEHSSSSLHNRLLFGPRDHVYRIPGDDAAVVLAGEPGQLCHVADNVLQIRYMLTLALKLSETRLDIEGGHFDAHVGEAQREGVTTATKLENAPW